jgi:hypothetical protein
MICTKTALRACGVILRAFNGEDPAAVATFTYPYPKIPVSMGDGGYLLTGTGERVIF